jgi:hypothetical protein
MTDCNCPTCQGLPTKHRLAAERDEAEAKLLRLAQALRIIRDTTAGYGSHTAGVVLIAAGIPDPDDAPLGA